ncbi:prolyl oligopeptidase family serine peptidase [Nocardioides sp.]|uniref:prolyl oligopeptidase family serine peptidase n=1 Tax=Nocardioides sp. TaxID=35761 RepID=UPI003528F5AD
MTHAAPPTPAAAAQPPQAPQEPFTHTEHGVPRPDPFHWMREAGDPRVLAHLRAERAFFDWSCAHLDSLVSALKAEMHSRLAPTEISPTWRRTRFSYYTFHPAGSQYTQLLREIRMSDGVPATDPEAHLGSDDGNRSVVLDHNLLAEGSDYLDVGVSSVSPDEDWLAYSVDLSGEEVFELRFRDLRTGADLDEVVPRTYYSGAWSADSAWFFYTVHDEAYRPFQVWRHRLGTPVAEDVLVHEEPDERFELQVRATRSGDLVVLWSASNTTAECWTVDAHDLDRGPWSVGGRRAGVKYHAEHRRGYGGPGDLLVVTDDDAVELRLMTAPVPDGADQDHTSWREARPEDPADRLERVDAFDRGVVLSLRSGGDHVLRMLPHDDLAGPGHDVRSRFPGGEAYLFTTPLYDAPAVGVVDEAYTEPAVWSEVSWATGETVDVHRQEAPGHDPSAYVTERRSFPSADGTLVPATIVRHHDTPLDGTAAALVYGYGSYEAVFEPEWDPALPSFLDRGAVFCFAHLRGGGEMGRAWYLDGKLAHKQHTFDDQIAVADGLARDGLVDPDRIASRGLSAGGLLQGAVFSQRPDRWRAVVAEVPFVDVVTTMFDETTPLTITEWEEWGDPRVREQFDWMLAYSPYENLPPAGSRPDLLVTGAVHDPRVMVREPAKWVAALRASDPQWSSRCLFRCETGAGAHVGPSGRFGHLDYEADVYAWLIDRLGLPHTVAR